MFVKKIMFIKQVYNFLFTRYEVNFKNVLIENLKNKINS